MKKLSIFLVGSILLFATSCSKDDDTVLPEKKVETVGFYALSEGTWGAKNASLAFYDAKTKVVIPDFYGSVNSGKKIGDTANDLLIYGSKMYIVVDLSNKVIVADVATGKLLKEVDCGGTSTVSVDPRRAAGYKGDVYISTHLNGVLVLDTTSLSFKSPIAVTGAFSEGICVINDKLYVANSGNKGDYYGGEGTTISVIDLSSKTEIKTIKVEKNPNRLGTDGKGNLYVATWGDYSAIPAKLWKINTTSDNVEHVADNVAKFSINNGFAYTQCTSYIGGVNTFVSKVNLATKEVITFIQDPASLGFKGVYDVQVNPLTGDVFYTDESGLVACFDAAGNKKFDFKTEGKFTNTVAFLNK